MPTDPPAPQKPPQKSPLSPAAERALAEAEARRAERARQTSGPGEDAGKEIDGPNGPEPTRYGDWEINGIAADF